ncbi:MAG: TPM domain-containing protein [Erysipelotrichaceae bacterium]|nr:TPM domain-containing protein [Erysipelotrichaceae bacterium]
MRKLLSILFVSLLLLSPIKVVAGSANIIDEVGVLSDDEKQELTNYYNSIANQYDIQVVAYITDTPTDNIDLQAADYFESLGYSNGFIFEINMANSEYDIVILGDEQYLAEYIEEGMDYVYSSLSNGDFAGACRDFGYFVDEAHISHDYNEEQQQPSKPSTVQLLTISACTGGVISLIAMFIMYKQLKTEGKKYDASNYVKNSNFNLFRQGDIFLYRTMNRRRRPRVQNNNNNNHFHGGGSFTSGHTSSGHSFSGGGGHKF